MHNNLAKQLIRAEIQALQAYHVQPSNGLVKLDIMENPYDWSAELKAAWLEKLHSASINRYPDAQGQNIKEKLLAQMTLPDSCDVMFGNGSDELIQIIIQSLAVNAGPVMSVSPTFVMFRILAEVTSKEYIDVPLNSDFSLNSVALVQAIERHRPACLFLAYPNNPTGNLFSERDLDQIIAASKGLVIIDEAYLPFAGTTQIDRLNQYSNVLIMRTLSKAGLAGLRFGMLFGDKQWLDEFNKIRLPFNINSLTQISVEFALDNMAFFENNAEKIVAERTRVYDQLCRLSGLQVYPSDANFILFKSIRIPATQLFEGLLERHILIKCVHKPDTMLEQCLRVTIGTEQENNLFLNSIEDLTRGLA